MPHFPSYLHPFYFGMQMCHLPSLPYNYSSVFTYLWRICKEQICANLFDLLLYSLYIVCGESSLENSLSSIWKLVIQMEKELEMLIYAIVSVDPQIVIFFFVIYKSFSVQYSPSCPFSNMRTWKQLVIEARFLFFCLLVFNVFDLKSCGSLFPHPR